MAPSFSVHEGSAAGIGERWRRYVAGSGAIRSLDNILRLSTGATNREEYSDAQIDDYASLTRGRFPWRWPLQLHLQARFSHPVGELRGTAGFGFWNDPFVMTGGRLPALPRAVWFFYASPPSDLKLDASCPGHGWKAATIDALHTRALLLAPLAPAVVVAMNVRRAYRTLWPPIQRTLRIREAAIDVDFTEWHVYTLDWREEATSFAVDGQTVLSNAPSPRGPLGFVMWLDNQYMVATPWGRFRWGLLDCADRQWMEVRALRIERE